MAPHQLGTHAGELLAKVVSLGLQVTDVVAKRGHEQIDFGVAGDRIGADLAQLTGETFADLTGQRHEVLR